MAPVLTYAAERGVFTTRIGFDRIALDAAGNVVVPGTRSNDFQMANPSQPRRRQG